MRRLFLLAALLLALDGCGWPFTCAPMSNLIATCGHPAGKPSDYPPVPSETLGTEAP